MKIKKINKYLNSDFKKVNDQIDYSPIENDKKKINKGKVIGKIAISLCCCVFICLLLTPVLAFMNIKDSFNVKKEAFSINQVHEMQGNSFKSLNSVTYPELDNIKYSYEVDSEYAEAINAFATKMNSTITLDQSNVVYSPLSLYSCLDILSVLTDDLTTKDEFNDVLCLADTFRSNNYQNMFKNNYYVTDSGTVQMYNGLFIDNSNTINQEILPQLTSHYVEAFEMNFQNDKDVSNLLKWIDGKIDERNFLKKEDLEIESNTAFASISTLYFKNRWKTKYNKKNSYEDVFYGTNSNNKVTYMNHTFMNNIYDYGEFLTVKDYYQNGYSIKYVLPKDSNKLIYNLISGVDLFKDDESKLLIPEKSEYDNEFVIDLSLPKFDAGYYTNFNSNLKAIGLNKAYDEMGHSFDKIYTDLDEDESIYLKTIKQKNIISFDEDGTTAKSVTFGVGADKAEMINLNKATIKLCMPFIYIIQDNNNLPLYFGTVNNL